MQRYRAPYVLRCQQEGGHFVNEGFNIVPHGIIELENNELRVYDGDEYGGVTNHGPVLCIYLDRISAVKFSHFVSKGRNYRGGVVRIDGVFDRQVEERLTLKMPLDEYSALCTQLKVLLRGVYS